MPTLPLTARTVDSLKPTATRTEYFDATVPGLALRVQPSGSKSWTVLYRHRARLRRITLGSAEVLSLANARDRAREVLRDATKGADPATVKQDGRTAETFADLATTYIDKHAKPRKRSWKADDNLLRNKVLPKWRNRAIADITRQDVIRIVEGVAEAGAPVVANRVAALLSKVFAFALDRDLVTASPAVRIPRPGVEQARDRVLSETELRALWRAFDGLEASMAAFYKLRLVTAQRGGEVAAMRWQDLDLHGKVWTIPAAGTKNKLAHRVPLSKMALDILRALQPEKVNPFDFVLAGARGKRQQAEAAATFTVKNFRGHDLRRTAASLMVGAGVPRLVVGKVLNHVERSITAVYDRHGYDDEKRAALDGWARTLTAIVTPKKSGTIVKFRKASR